MYYTWKPYVPVAKRRANSARLIKQQAKKTGRQYSPVIIPGRKIATTFWGSAWCDHLEKHCDYENRLPRGRTYVRGGAVIDLQISPGQVSGLVSGSSVYKVHVKIKTLDAPLWEQICNDCGEQIDSLLDLLQGKFSSGVMRRLTDKEQGMFPRIKEFTFSCSCPDWAVMCKHVAAVLYGVGNRLDQEPELLFKLRGVDQQALLAKATTSENLDQSLGGDSSNNLANADLGAIFGIELADKTDANVSKANASSNGDNNKNSDRVAQSGKRQKSRIKKRPPQKSAKNLTSRATAKKPGSVKTKKSMINQPLTRKSLHSGKSSAAQKKVKPRKLSKVWPETPAETRSILASLAKLVKLEQANLLQLPPPAKQSTSRSNKRHSAAGKLPIDRNR
ncbi:MAG: SWIM zinc finger family protein [Pirellulales bacterium]|nr:SWIM zinc finger family protein [Pirellulales bacterium]